MLIAEDAGRESAKSPEPGAFDSALVVVHGMGSAYTSQILLEWAEPLLERMDWIARDRIIGGRDEHGVTIVDSELTGDVPIVTATVAFPTRGTGRVEDGAVVDAETTLRRIAIVEARWSESFVPMSRAQVFRWAVPFMWRALTRMLGLFRQTLVMLPWLTLVEHQRPPHDRLLLGRTLTAIVDVVRVAVLTVVFAAVWLGVVLLGVVLTPVLPLLSPLLLIPWFKELAQGVLDALVGSIGDVAAWKERPVRASAMRLVVRDALARARELVGDDGDVHLFAHSQGAAVATFALFEELDPAAFNVRRLTTVGAAVVLLGRENWRGRSDRYAPVANWIGASPERPVAWANHWAVWDPFSAGPIADSRRAARERWRAAYFPRPGDAALGPEEHAVHNTSQPFLDHSEYYRNVVQVVDPTARHLLGPALAARPAEVEYLENRLAVIDKKSLGTNLLAALVTAAILPGLPAASAAFAWLVRTVTLAVGAVAGVFTGAPAEDALSSLAWLVDDGRLTDWGWLIAAALVAALLIWLNQLLNGLTQRSLVWQRCPMEARRWLVLTALPRVGYVAAAAVTVWCAIAAWTTPPLPATALWAWGLGIGLVAAFVIAEPRFAPSPVVVPARRVAPGASATAELPPPMTIGRALTSSAYQDELAARRRLLTPTTAWSRFWARVLHGWRG
ncbi:hypothetical protein ACFOE1_11790 [Agromyces mediolanus]|uniref:Uncharacterized protein n=1 Tax=Agromyces mediolanus TaxID=41986 RepID=A0A918F6U5_AGRME|nr:hypothetical protein [Agromyces mediolanus]GGR13956.1 hypothetical protein GCM10010196_03140 [Agromyces mediolanus]GLJ72718.1 hypothetical protein GCM10017583_19740 [Agromyces mediolanus]